MPSNLAAAATRSGSMAKWLLASILRKRRKPLLPTSALSPWLSAFSSPARAAARGGIVARFGLIITDNIAATPWVALTRLGLSNDFLDLKIERAAAIGLGNCQRYERGLVG